MKKILFIIASIATLLTVSCTKQETPFVENHDPARRTFRVEVQQTKTTLDGLAVKWASTDEIRVLGYTAGSPASIGQAVFKLKSGEGSSSAEFEIKEGESLDEYDSYFAVYPADKEITTSSLPDKITFASEMTMAQTAVENGFDPSYAIMTARYSEGKLVFTHGCAYIKLQMIENGVTNVNITFGNNTIEAKPVYSASDGVLTAEGTHRKVVSASGTFVKDSYYFLPVPARPNQNPGNITIQYTKGGDTQSKVTSSLSKTKLENGNVYNLGCPPILIGPVISASNVSIAQDATSGNIAFTIIDPAGDGEITIAETGGKTNPDGFVLDTTPKTEPDRFSFTCYANGDSSPRNYYVTLTYTYNSGADEVTKDVVITQAGAAIHKDWNFSSSEWQTVLSTNASSACLETNGNTNVDGWSVSYDGLSYTSGGGNGKWSSANGYIQPNGSGSTTKRCFSFTAPVSGTLIVTAASASSGNERNVAVKCGTSSEVTKGCDAKTDMEFDVTAGTVYVYPKAGLRFYRIKFDSE